jgi:hypothetical protein
MSFWFYPPLNWLGLVLEGIGSKEEVIPFLKPGLRFSTQWLNIKNTMVHD